MPHDPALIAEVRAWLSKAAKDLAAADYELRADPPFVEDIVFHSQQAVEKSLKAFLSWHVLPFRKTHNLVGCPTHFVTIQSAETSLGTAGKSARATLWRALQRAASALMPTLGWPRVESSAA